MAGKRRSNTPRPTDAELAILTVLWSRGPSTVRDVHDELSQSQDTGYTTVLKLLQIMGEKGLVTRVSPTRPHVYRATAEAGVKRRLVADLLDKVFDGSAMNLVMQALSARPASRDELRQLRELLDGMEGDRS